MGMKWLRRIRQSATIGFLVVFTISAPAVVLAASGPTLPLNAWHGHGPLVALGDSITFGYNLGNNKRPSHQAFPYLMGTKLHVGVSDLGVPGWTSAQLLDAIQTNDAMRHQIGHAGIVTVDIGSNDLLQTAFRNGQTLNTADTQVLESQLTATVKTLGSHINEILDQINKLNPQADVVVYNLYNPISPANENVHNLADYALQAANLAIAEAAVAHHDTVADAYDALHNYSEDVLPGDVHPTVKGQALLAGQGDTALNMLQFERDLQSPAGLQGILSWLQSPFI